MRDVGSEALPSPAESARGGAKSYARLISLTVSAALLFVLYRSLNLRLVGEALRQASPTWLVVSVAMIAPITLVRALRFLSVAPAGALPGVGEALRLTLVASAVNVFLPAKSGDLIKSYFVTKRGGTSPGVAIAIIVYERLCDLFGLIFWCVLGWWIAREEVSTVPSAIWPLLGGIGIASAVLISSETVAGLSRGIVAKALPHPRLRKLRQLAEGWPDLLELIRGRRGWVILLSVFLWLGHLIQLWMFTRTLSVQIPFAVCATFSAVALMAGQLPFTFAGLGARDMAIVVLFERHMTPEAAAAMGILILTRNLLPPLAALPIMRPYLSAAIERVGRSG